MSMMDLERRIVDIESRLAKIEAQLKITSQSQLPSSERWTEALLSHRDLAEKPIPQSTGTSQPSSAKATGIRKESNWLGIISMICFIVAAAFIIKLSIDSGWLTPTRQIILAYVFGLCLISVGFLIRKQDLEYAIYLPAAGIIVLYLATYTAKQYYELIPFTTAIAITSLVSILCLYLYMYFKYDLYVIVATLGTYLSPIIFNFHPLAIFTLYYYIVCSLAFASIAIWINSRLLMLIAAYTAIVTTGIIGFSFPNYQLISTTLAIHFLIFALASYLLTRKTHQPMTQNEAWSFFPVLIIFYTFEYYFTYQFAPTLAPWYSLIFAAILLLLYFSAKRRFKDQALASEPIILSFLSLVFFHSVYLELLPESMKPWLFAFILLGFIFVPAEYFRRKLDNKYIFPGIALLAVLLIEYLTMIYDLLTRQPKFNLTALFITSIIVLWCFTLSRKQDIFKQRENISFLLAATHLLAIVGLYNLTTNYNSLVVSAAWLLYGVIVMLLAFIKKDKIIAQSALFVLGFAAAKALLYDAASTPTIIRILCLLLTGFVLYGTGFLMRKITTLKD